MDALGIVVMAAGKGTRLKSSRPKVLHAVGGKLLLQHVIDAALQLVPASAMQVVIGHQADLVREAMANTGVHFVLQAQQLGTGHALQCVKQAYLAAGAIPPENLIVLSGDVPLIRPETIDRLWQTHTRESAAMTILTAVPENPSGYGRVLRKSPSSAEVRAIVEQKSLTPEQLAHPDQLREINSGIYAFRTETLFRSLDALTNTNSAGEFYLTDVAALLTEAGERVVAVAADSVDEVLGANTIAEMMHLDAALRRATADRLMAAGVTIFRPDTVVIDSTVAVGPDTVLEPYVQLLGNTRIGSHCRVRSYSTLENSTVGDGVLIRNGCILDSAEVAANAVLGPYAHLRPQSRIGEGAHVGNFVETKKAVLGAGSKANHLSYLGDAEIGAGVNIGAGVITCNYDGANKHVTRVGDRSFIGSDSTLVAPLSVEPDSYVAAGSCITENVPSGALALGRSRQVNKPGWAQRLKAKQKEAKA
ncbi:bifunctional UDP-N-acetylglucosamine diphosphorylase/glucosamine-1-phosphate N-acetyltransferase GlmU [Terriglobus sp.]|uniref:bifunctional UDP-N-acetylglucosamine diphosphorylase/glucosamine-1-phosphate N-acetyltransferase GlmU n=1 Tax=Terriglobus sp. TaxID=1889013 RepID=UPI003B0021DF